MSDKSAFGFGQFVPGFDFLQNLAKTASATQSAGQSIPGMSSWVAPTLSVEELDKRIQELKAVQFWLEQNGTALKATIQALEVQKMTLTTLQGMNVNMAELAKAFTAKAPQPAAPSPASGAAAQTPPESAPADPAPKQAEAPSRSKASTSRKTQAAPATSKSAVDPMQWWGSLTQQFQNIATAAMQDAAAQAMKAKAGQPKATSTAQARPAKAAVKKSATPKSAVAKTRRRSA